MGRDSDYEVVNLQAAAGQGGLVESLVRRGHTRIRDNAGPWQRTKDAFDRLAGLNVGVAGLSAGINTHPGPDHVTRPDPGTLAETLVSLATEIRRDRPNGGLLITLDEVQVAQHTDLALLAATLHRLNVDHPGAAVAFAGTGLPHTPDELRKAGVTHPDRLFVLEPLPLTLSADEAAYAIVEPARRAGVAWHPGAVEALVVASNGYPAHVQLFAHETWVGAPGPHTITVADAHAALPRAADRLEKRTLGPRWDRMPDRQMEFLAALAVNDGHARTGQLSRTLGRSVQELSWVRQALLEEGDVFAPRRGTSRSPSPSWPDTSWTATSRHVPKRPPACSAWKSCVPIHAGPWLLLPPLPGTSRHSVPPPTDPARTRCSPLQAPASTAGACRFPGDLTG